jgi:excisionase family DNA binding protein
VTPDLLSIAQVAERLSVTEAAVRKWLAQRRLPVVKLGRLSRIPTYALAVIAEHGLPDPGTYPRPKSPRGKAIDILARQV